MRAIAELLFVRDHAHVEKFRCSRVDDYAHRRKRSSVHVRYNAKNRKVVRDLVVIGRQRLHSSLHLRAAMRCRGVRALRACASIASPTNARRELRRVSRYSTYLRRVFFGVPKSAVTVLSMSSESGTPSTARVITSRAKILDMSSSAFSISPASDSST